MPLERALLLAPMTIREASESDLAPILEIHRAAFGANEGPVIADLVVDLLADETARPLLSLVAEIEGGIAGHVLFTTVRLRGAGPPVRSRILAPLAVAPPHQLRGLGSALVRDGLHRLATDRVALVFVLGDPRFYGRFGFRPAVPAGLAPSQRLPPRHGDAWRVAALEPDVLGKVRGPVVCARSLERPEYW